MAFTGTLTHQGISTPVENAGQTFTSHTFTPSANSTLYVWATTESDNHSATYDWQISNTAGLTFTRVIQTAAIGWTSFPNYRACGVLFSAPVGASPSSMTVTVDPWATTDEMWWAQLHVFDITGSHHIVQLVANAEADGGTDTETHTTGTLGAAVTSGNLALLLHEAGGNAAVGSTTPSGWTSVAANSTDRHTAIWSRTDFTGTNVTITDLGSGTGQSLSVLLEIADEAGAGGGWSGAITLRVSYTEWSATAVQTHTSPSFTPAANSLLIVQYWATASTGDPDMSITNTGGLTFTKYQSALGMWGSGHNRMAVFVAPVGASPSAMTVTVDMFTDTSAAYATHVVYDVTDAEIVQTPAFNISSDPPGTESWTTGALGAAVASGNLAIAGYGKHTTSNSPFATPSGFTSLVAQETTYAANSVFYSTSFTGTSVTNPDMGDSLFPVGAFVLEITSPGGEVADEIPFSPRWDYRSSVTRR